METSTPINSPARKKLPNRASLIAIEDNEEHRQSELKLRRQEAINQSTEHRRRSVAPPLLAGLNAAQLAQHCKDCIKLSTENKINSKNAFSFLLIDAMAAMTKKCDSEMSKNFQVATCTLDASVKIYGYRVDAVHTEAMKIAGGFLGKEAEEALDGGDQSEGSGDDKNAVIKTKIKKKRRKNTIVAPSTLNAKSELEAVLDAAPKPNFLSKTADGSKLLTRVPKYNDSCLLMVDGDVPCWPYNENEQLYPQCNFSEIADQEELLKLFNEITVSADDKLCSAASVIEFNKDAEEEEEFELEQSQASAFEFDVNASIPQNMDDSMGDATSVPARLTVPCTGYDSGEEIAVPQQPVRKQTATITDMKGKLSLQNMEYSMFDEKVFKVWAGPTHWKVRSSRHSLLENKENEEGSRPIGAIKRTRRGKPKDVVGLFDIADDVLSRNFEASERTVLAKSTLINWKAATITLADDYKYSTKQLFTLFHLPKFNIKPQTMGNVEEILDENEDEEEYDDNAPVEELEYCSETVMEDHEDILEKEGETGNKDAFEVGEWDAENMVAPPSKIRKIEVASFHRKKHIDIKHLKKCIWSVVNDPPAEEKSDTSTVSFFELLNTCPSKLPRSIAEGLSAPLMFNALLHLTNEKSLVLQQSQRGKDFVIAQ